MARVCVIAEQQHPELVELIAKLRSGRGGELLNIYKLLLHSPRIAETWLEYFNAVRWQTEIPGRLRELVVIRIAHLNRSEYVMRQHVPRLAQAEGVSLEECAALEDWKTAASFDERERAALAFADEMTRGGEVSDSAFAELRRHFSERQVVELAVLVGAYNMHNRVFAALKIDLEPAR
jgi:4-carboxymuconolactone decarboxylase